MNAPSFTLSPQQSAARKEIKAWLDNPGRKQVFRLFGFAGTGKTSIAKYIAAEHGGTVEFAAFTGIAALNMAKSGCEGAKTIHKLIYRIRELPGGGARFEVSKSSAAANADFIIIDECSMVDDTMARDICSFKKPILVLGDPAQLPPIGGDGFFTRFKPDVMLTEIHRQARDSEIIRFSEAVREGKSFTPSGTGEVRFCNANRDWLLMMEADQIIAGTNRSVSHFNLTTRYFRGWDSDFPQAGERLVALRNDYDLGVLNGEQFAVIGDMGAGRVPETRRLKVKSLFGLDAEPVELEFFTDSLINGPSKEELFWCADNEVVPARYAYAITAHKAQGSQWPHVAVCDESLTFGDDARRWLYTAATRAMNRLTIGLSR